MAKKTTSILTIESVRLAVELKSRNTSFYEIVKSVYHEVEGTLNTLIPKVFSQYTLHDVYHSLRIMEHMFEIIPDVKKLTDFEITMLILSALLHDIGMAVSDEDLKAIKSDSYDLTDVKFSAMLKLKEGDKDLALEEFVRKIHAKRSAKYIITELKSKLTIPGNGSLNFSENLADICESHTEDFSWIYEKLSPQLVLGNHNCNLQFCASVLRLADIFDIDGQRTPYYLYKMINPKGVSDKEWREHYVINNFSKIKIDETTKEKHVFFTGECNDPDIHRRLLRYFDWVSSELKNSLKRSKTWSVQYRFILNNEVQISISAIGYTFVDFKMELNFKAISQLLMGENLYGDKKLGLRELVQNSIDACKVRGEKELQKQKFGDDLYEGKIKVIIDEDKNEVTIKDNGIGMTFETIKKHFLNIGVSYYRSDEFKLQGLNYNPIGNFGIGFLACFMLSEKVKVMTRNINGSKKISIDLEMGNEYTSITESEDYEFYGTSIILKYSSFSSAFNNSDSKNLTEAIVFFLKSYFLTDVITIDVVDIKNKKNHALKTSLLDDYKVKDGFKKIELDKYFKSAKGVVSIRQTGGFIKKISDISSFSNHFLLYDKMKLVVVPDIYDACKFIGNHNVLYVITIDYVLDKHGADYEELNSILDSDEDVMSKLISKDKTETLCICLINEADLKDFALSISGYNRNVKNASLQKIAIAKLGAYIDTPFLGSVKVYDLFRAEKNKLYLREERTNSFSVYDNGNSQLFLRNVLVAKTNIRFSLEEQFDVNKIKVNIMDPKIFPNISRNNFSPEITTKIDYSINMAIFRAYLDNFKLSKDKREALQAYQEKYFGNPSYI